MYLFICISVPHYEYFIIYNELVIKYDEHE